MNYSGNITSLPAISISPFGLTCFEHRLSSSYKRNSKDVYIGSNVSDDSETKELTKYNFDEYKSKDEHEELSLHSIKRIKNALGWLYFVAQPQRKYNSSIKKWVKFKLTFITLTLPSKQIHSDREIKSNALNHFLTLLRKRNNNINYIWRAEKQENGNIHFHIVADKYIDFAVLRSLWNRSINRLGYVDRYTEHMRNNCNSFESYCSMYQKRESMKTMKDRYARGMATNWTSPNSTDIHGLSKIKNVLNYITKYLTKAHKHNTKNKKGISNNQSIDGRMWGLSESLSKCRNVVILIDSEVSKDLKEIFAKVKSYEYKDDYFFYKCCTLYDYVRLNLNTLLNHIKEHLKTCFNEVELGFF